MTSARRWGVSNVGYPINSISPQYQISSQSQFTNTLDSELFRTARISAGSLRYYGLGLENGNYTVRLQFAESQILNTRTWERLGRRVFDIYIQVRCEVYSSAGRTISHLCSRLNMENYDYIYLHDEYFIHYKHWTDRFRHTIIICSIL